MKINPQNMRICHISSVKEQDSEPNLWIRCRLCSDLAIGSVFHSLYLYHKRRSVRVPRFFMIDRNKKSLQRAHKYGILL